MKRPRIKVKTKVKSKLELESVKIGDNVICPHCNQPIQRIHLANHIKKKHKKHDDNGTTNKKKKANLVKCQYCEQHIPNKDLEAHINKRHKDVINKQNVNKNQLPSELKRKVKTETVRISPKEVIQRLNPLGKIDHYNRNKTKWEEEFLQIGNYLQKYLRNHRI